MKIKHKRFGITGTVLNSHDGFYMIVWDKRPPILFNGGVKESLVLKTEVEEIKEEEKLDPSSYDYYYDF